jgi:CPA2 family monovalent cation:H+ antiporter-2
LPHGLIRDALTFLALAVVISPLCFRLRVSPVLGYLIVGSVVGPMGLGLIEDNEGARGLAELGIVFLLFMIGLELSWERLKVIRHFIFGLGSAQVLATGTLATLVLWWVGMEPRTALVIGLALAFSSTAFVLQILSDRGAMSSQTGRVAVAVLILQDLAVVPLLVLIPLLATSQDFTSGVLALGMSIGKAALAMGVIFAIARLALRPLFQAVAATHSPDVFVAAALLAVIGTAFATEAVGLSHSLGAFLAGVLLASTEYRHQVEAEIQPLRGLLMGLFFLTVGMVIDPQALLARVPEMAMMVGGLLAGKAVVLGCLALVFRFPWPMALNLGLLLCQGGEFVFVVLARAQQNGLADPATVETVTAVVALSMALTPFLAAIGDRVVQSRRKAEAEPLAPGDDTKDLSGHVILMGCGRAGQIVAAILSEQGIPFVALDRDPRLVEVLRRKGLPAYFADVRKVDVLAGVGAKRAKLLVMTIGSGSGREKLVPRLRRAYPDLQMLVRSRDRRQARHLESLGAHGVVPEILEGSLHLAGKALLTAGLPSGEVQDLIASYRRNDYERLALTEDAE